MRKSDTGKGFWTRICAAWANRNGEGFSIKLDLIPLDGADIVVRTPATTLKKAVPHETPHPEAV